MARILVADDEPDIVRFVVDAVTSRGHQVQTAAEGPEALAAARRGRPDAIVLDLYLPQMDGREVCRRLKADPATREIPVVLLTSDYLALEEVGREESADAFVVRPFVREVLLQNLDRLLPGGERRPPA